MRWCAGLAALSIALGGGCFRLMEGEGGGQTTFEGPRSVDPTDIAMAPGYRIRPIAGGLTFPTDLVFDEAGRMYVVEGGYSYGEVFVTPRILRIDAGGERVEIARGDNPPWTGADYRDGKFYVAGGHLRPGQVLEIEPGGATRVLVDGLSTSVGDHHTNGPRVGPDGFIYFSQGPLTNSAVVGLDNHQMGWLAQHPEAHDVPCKDIVLAGRNYETETR